MQVIGQKMVENGQSDVSNGEFNGGEHTMLRLEPGKYQTISVQLPTGNFVTLAFVPGHRNEADFECMDIHTTVGPRVPRTDGGQAGYLQHLVGFTVGTDTFTTRGEGKMPTTLATLLLREEHYNNPQTMEQAKGLLKRKQQEDAARKKVHLDPATKNLIKQASK